MMGRQQALDFFKDMPSLEGKHVVVTGSNRGIGLCMAEQLALHGATVYLACRSEKAASVAIDGLLKKHTSLNLRQLIWIPFDLCSARSIGEAADLIAEKTDKLDILINNASYVTNTNETYWDGWEPHMASSHAAHFLFTNRLIPLLENAAADKDSDVRIVNFGSDAALYFVGKSYPFRFDDEDLFSPSKVTYRLSYRIVHALVLKMNMLPYGVAKMACHLFGRELQNRLNERGSRIISVIVNPGGVKTDTAVGCWKIPMVWLFNAISVSVEEGAVTGLFAATQRVVREEKEKYGGRFLDPPGKLIVHTELVNDRSQVEGLWENTTKAVNGYLRSQGLPLLGAW